MVKQPNVLLFGFGSIGAMYLHQIRQVGCIATSVCRSNYSAIKENGFRSTSKRLGNVRYRPDSPIRSVPELAPDCFYDYILVTTKVFAGSKLSTMDMIRPVVGSHIETAIVLCQNGIGIEDEAAQAFPNNLIPSGVIYLPTTQASQGIIHYPVLGFLELGTFPANDVPASHKKTAVKFADLMVKGGGDVWVYDDIQVTCRSKWIPNDLGILYVLWHYVRMAASYFPRLRVLKTVSGADDGDCGAGSHDWDTRGGRQNDREGVDDSQEKRASSRTGREVSMPQDIRQGRLFGAQAIIGNIVFLGQKRGVKMPRLETVYALVKKKYEALLHKTQSE